ncbi:phosphodiesterase [Reyranella sp. CPCC 100927]|uniref:phosphodiesterase n=1 Tax=Reyranella sp. CPCC 100927 TaxID=2599616 RepID=UPI0011B4B803|nr:phosphodiesterase [Reyranella sp. CPCC 100927]TWS97571.1 phosphodiesterase [Reyranella sp. CPCC 100927]
MLIAQISDTHIKPDGQIAYRRVDTADFLAKAVAHLNALHPRPDLVLVTGDLVDAGAPIEYARLKALLAPLAMPFYLIVGNHDARDALRAAFTEHRYLPADGFVQYVIEGHPVRLIGLDTLVPGEGHGEMCATRLDWLEARLAESDRPTILFMHHPPFECGMAYMDGERLRDGADRLATIVQRHPNIERVLCGHVHRSIQVRWAGTIAATAPSTAHQLTLDLDPAAPLTFKMDPPGALLHAWRPGSGLVSHISFIGDYDGPHRFR